MKHMLMLTGLAAALALGGCQNKQDDELTRVPPPAYDETAAPEPIPAPGSYDAQNNGGDTGTGSADQMNQQAPAPQPMNNAAPQAGTYTIRKGDTLWSIAQQVYGDGQRWQDIVNANPGLDPNKLRVGQKIVLP